MSGGLTQSTVFYSWESDLSGKAARNLIEGCLNTAIRQLGREDDLDVDPSYGSTSCDPRQRSQLESQ